MERAGRRQTEEREEGASTFTLVLIYVIVCVFVSPLSTFLKNKWKEEKDRRATEDANRRHAEIFLLNTYFMKIHNENAPARRLEDKSDIPLLYQLSK